MPIPAKKKRCKNCRKLFEPQYDTQVYCTAKCRADFHNNGKTPEAQMLNRLQRFMKKPAFKTLLREAILKELRALKNQGPTIDIPEDWGRDVRPAGSPRA